MGQKFSAFVKSDSLANAGAINLQINTPASGLIKLRSIIGAASGVSIVSLLEAPTITNGTTVVSPINLMRINKTLKPGTLVLFSDPTSISVGTEIERIIVDVTKVENTNVLENNSIYLLKNTKYNLSLTNVSGSAIHAQIKIIWEEEI